MRWALVWPLWLSTLSWAAPGTADDAVRDLQARGALELPAGWKAGETTSVPWGRASFVRLEQQIGGVPVEGGALVLSLDPAGEVRHVRGQVAPEATVSLLPTLDRSAAIAKVDDVREWMGDGQLWPDRASVRLWFDADRRSHLVWAVELSTAAPVATWRVLVDAHSGEVLRGARTSRDARGRVYPQNPEVSELEIVDLPRLTSDETLLGTYCRVQTCERGVAELPVGPTRCYEASARAVPDEDGDYIYDPLPGSLDDPFAEVNAYYQVDRVADWYVQELDYRRAEVIEVYTKFPMENALFGDVNGDGVGDIALGYSDRTDFAYDGDVLAHEFGHGLLDILWDHPIFEADEYGILVNSMAMDEGFADVFAMSMFGDAQVGEYAGRDGEPIRDLEPDHRCPDDLFGESHYDGMIWASMAWNMMDDPAVGNSATVALVVGTAAGLPTGGNFDEAATVMVETARDLRADGVIDDEGLHAIEGHIEASGVQGCERVIALDDGAQPRTLAMWSGLLELLGREHMATVAQYSLTVPERADQLVFEITEWRHLGDASHDFTVFVRRGSPIGHELNPAPLVGDLSDPVDFDWRVDGDAPGFVALVQDSKEQPLIEGETWYFAVASRGNGEGRLWDQAVARVEGHAVLKERGMACACSGSGSASGWWLLPLVFMVMSTRRRADNGELF